VLRLLLSTPHHPRVILLGKSLASLVIGVVQALVVLVAAAPFVEFEWQYGVVPGFVIAVSAVVLLNLMLTGLAQAFASRIQSMQGFHLLMNLALFPLLFFSGAFFPIDGLPVWLRVMAFANPLTYAVDAMQLAAYAAGGEGFIGLPIDFAVLGTVAVLVYALGLSRIPRLTHSGQ
jgi:ABC-2 type transport system permease protein